MKITSPSYFSSPELLNYLITEPLYRFESIHPESELPLVGDFSQKVLVIVHDSATETPNPLVDSLLTKILKSVGIELSSAYLLITNSSLPYSLFRIIKILQPKKVLVFGGEKSFLFMPENWTKYECRDMGFTQTLWADSLDNLESDPEKILKNKLWTQLKILFKLG